MGLVVVHEKPRIANGRVWVDSSVGDIDYRIKHGDATLGWRGDPSMFLMLHPVTGHYEVWGTDRAGNQYMCCSHPFCDVTLIKKLVDGDPTRNDVIGRILADNEKLKKDREDAERDKRLEVADKLGWAIRQDFGQHLGGRKRIHGMYDGKKG